MRAPICQPEEVHGSVAGHDPIGRGRLSLAHGVKPAANPSFKAATKHCRTKWEPSWKSRKSTRRPARVPCSWDRLDACLLISTSACVAAEEPMRRLALASL